MDNSTFLLRKVIIELLRFYGSNDVLANVLMDFTLLTYLIILNSILPILQMKMLRHWYVKVTELIKSTARTQTQKFDWQSVLLTTRFCWPNVNLQYMSVILFITTI